LKIEKTHPHGKDCYDFSSALEWGLIIVIDEEVQITGKLPEGATAGNVLTGEKYDPTTFLMNMVIKFCPFCGKKLK